MKALQCVAGLKRVILRHCNYGEFIYAIQWSNLICCLRNFSMNNLLHLSELSGSATVSRLDSMHSCKDL